MHTGGSVYTQIMCRQYFSDKSVSCNLYEIAARPIGGSFFVGGWGNPQPLPHSVSSTPLYQTLRYCPLIIRSLWWANYRGLIRTHQP